MRRKQTAVKLFLIVFLLQSSLFAQTDSLKALLSAYKFIKTENNVISNPACLDTFFETLYQLKTNKSEIVPVVHIGDSHIQADYFSGMMRMSLQRAFGNAGRGLIFPYKVAKTNEPYNYKTSSNAEWGACRIVFPNPIFPIGVCGITMRTSNPKADIRLKTFNYPGLDYSFRHIDIYQENDTASFGIGICDTLGNVLQNAVVSQNPQYKFLSTINLPVSINEVILNNLCTDTVKQKYSQIYGLVLRNDSNGLIYHTIGINGAMYQNYSSSRHFCNQLQTLKPRLIIISLGTNEAQSLRLTKEQFYLQIDSLVNQLKANTKANFLLTLPQDSYRRKCHYNPQVKMIAETLIEYAKKNKIAYWDYYTIAGGYKSCYSWKKKGLIRQDGLHLNRAGYEIQGKLLYTALLNAYNRYVSDRHP